MLVNFFTVCLNGLWNSQNEGSGKDMILNISDITKSFDGKDVLRGVSFHIEDHEKAALVGVNGAGKSTL